MSPLLLALLACASPPPPVEVHIEPEPVTPGAVVTCAAANLPRKAEITYQWIRDEQVVATSPDPRWPADLPLAPGDRLACRVRAGARVGPEARAVVRPPPAGGTPPNILILLADDVGVDQLRAFEGGSRAPRTPTLDRLADEGVRFRRAYANPVCSPTRAAVLTGRYVRRSGVGTGVTLDSHDVDLSPDEILLPEMLRASPAGPWDTSMVGKWHLSADSQAARRAPLDQGFGWFAGTPGNLSDDNTRGNVKQGYFHWQKSTNGDVAFIDRYATTDTIDDALARATAMREPWLLYVALHASHPPLHVPPPELRGGGPPPSTHLEKYQAAITALDTELGRLLRDLPAERRDRTLVLFLGDNGSPSDGVLPSNRPEKAKGTLFEGGVHVPMIAWGAGVTAGGSSDALVSATDLFATVAELARVPLPLRRPDGREVALDGVSLVPYLADPTTPSIRPYAYVELFSPPACAPGACRVDQRGLVGPRYKLTWDAVDGSWQLVDLAKDPGEQHNLVRTESAEIRRTGEAMRAELERLYATLQEDHTR